MVQATSNGEYPDIDSAKLAEMGAIELRNLSMRDLIGAGILHTKLWIVDDNHFYIGSANMDWRSLTQVRQSMHLFLSSSLPLCTETSPTTH